MSGNRDSGKKDPKSVARPHEEFLELCAISTTGELSEQEERSLEEHLAACSDCRQALAEFEAAAQVVAPLLASELAAQASADRVLCAPEFRDSPSDEEIGTAAGEFNTRSRQEKLLLPIGNGRHGAHLNWNYLWMPFAAAVALIIALGVYSYQVGRLRGVEVAQNSPTVPYNHTKVDALERRLSDTGHDRAVLETQLAERDRIIRELRRQIEVQLAELRDARNIEASLEHSLQADQASAAQVTQQQSALNQKLDTAQASLEKAQGDLASVQQARERDEVLTESLTAQIKDLYGQLRGREETINQQQDMLADDRDIRDLMGARNLYIAEVYDVARDGTTRKPYGRVFYTKGKSLVFYAYDLDQQPGVKKASTFQAWGEDGPSRQRALNLGVFYQDSVAQKRWVLKFDDPRALDQINAVFVTVEPHGGSEEPSGKRLLFASLRIEPNHP